jgi:hypothetical protein
MEQEPADQEEKMRELLLSYVGLLAERHAYAPDEGFEYALWDDLSADRNRSDLVSAEERDELEFLVVRTNHFVTYNLETGMFQLIDLDEWKALLARRHH